MQALKKPTPLPNRMRPIMKEPKGAAWVGDDLWDGSDDDQDVANSGEADGYINGLELSPIFVGDPTAWMG
jgi:hypothetical protein